MGGNGLAGDDAALIERGEQSALSADHLPGAFQADMRLQPLDRRKVEPLGYRAALCIIGNEIEPVPVTNLVEAELVGDCRSWRSLSPTARASARMPDRSSARCRIR